MVQDANGWKCVLCVAVNLREKQGQVLMILVGQALDLGLHRQKEAFEKILSTLATIAF